MLLATQVTAGIRVYHPHVNTFQAASANATESTIDHIVTNTTAPITNVIRYDELQSDHWAIGCTVGAAIVQRSESSPDYARANWRTFADEIRQELNNINIPETVEELDETIDQFTAAIHRARRRAVTNFKISWQHKSTPADTLQTQINSNHQFIVAVLCYEN